MDCSVPAAAHGTLFHLTRPGQLGAAGEVPSSAQLSTGTAACPAAIFTWSVSCESESDKSKVSDWPLCVMCVLHPAGPAAAAILPAILTLKPSPEHFTQHTHPTFYYTKIIFAYFRKYQDKLETRINKVTNVCDLIALQIIVIC